jgi:SsrA-binding protein
MGRRAAGRVYSPVMAKQLHDNRQPSQKREPPKKDPNALDTGKLAPRIVNRRATFDYFIVDKIECGIALVGSEVKSVRQGKVQLAPSFARIRNGQVWLMGCHIDEYVEANQLNHDPTRTRQLLMHRREIRRLEQKLQKESGGGSKEKGGAGKGGGATLIPLEIYFRRGYAKVLLGIGKGKRTFDKRHAIKERDDKRSMEKALRRR